MLPTSGSSGCTRRSAGSDVRLTRSPHPTKRDARLSFEGAVEPVGQVVGAGVTDETGELREGVLGAGGAGELPTAYAAKA